MAPAPCKGCEKREIGCHAHCEGYRAFKANRDRIKEIRAAEERAFPQMPMTVIREIWRRQKSPKAYR